MLLASAVDITIGWLWHTAYRARWHWKLKREGALVAAGFVAFVGAVDTARSLHATQPSQTAALSTPALVTPQPVAANLVPATAAPAPSAQPAGNNVQAFADPNAPQFPIIQDQTGSIDQADPIETILPMDPAAERDDPIARKINERFGDAVETPTAKKSKPKPVKTAAAKAVKPTKPAKKPAADQAVD